MNSMEPTKGFSIFETAIGACAIVWGENGIVALRLPEQTAEKIRAHIRRRFLDAKETAAPAEIQKVIDRISALLAGQQIDLSDVRLDMTSIPEFNRRVYEIARTVQPGETISYGEITKRLNEPREVARDVGQALGKNPFPIVVPCHRVLAANGKPGGFSAPGGVDTKLRMLSIEGAKTGDQPTLFENLPLRARTANR